MTDTPGFRCPKLSAIVVFPDAYSTVERTMNALKNQTAASEMEIVFVAPVRCHGSIPRDSLGMFQSVQVVDSGECLLAPAVAMGVRHALAPVVAFTEDHAFPAPNWAESLLAAHSKPYAVVGPAMRNADPSTLVSWADFYMGYGKWAAPIDSGEQDFLMGHNASYKKAVLLAFAERLPDMLESETVLQYDLARRGEKFWLEANTHTDHMCFGKWGPWLRCMLWHGRMFAGRRAERWSWARRILYVCGAPLIPFVRSSRIRHAIARAKPSFTRRIQLWVAVLVGLFVEAAGQAAGYALGPGETAGRSFEYEFHRERHRGTVTIVSAE